MVFARKERNNLDKYGLRDKKSVASEVNLKKVSINGNICGEFVEFSMLQVYENKTGSNIDAVYTFPLPETAVLTGFEAMLGGRTLKAMVEDKKESVRIFKDAVESGLNAISIEEFEDNIYKLSIGNILPNETVKINISYMDQLLYEDTSFKLMIPTVVGARHIHDKDLEEDDVDYKLTMNLLVESFDKLDIKSPSHKIIVDIEDDTLCKVSLEEGQFLDDDFILILKEEKSKEHGGMFYRYNDIEEETGILYLRLIPKLDYIEEEHQVQNYDFLIDLSESMEGDKIEEAKNALQICLRNLEEGDSFNIIGFNEKLNMFSKNGKVIFNEENLYNASKWIDNLEPHEGADIFSALRAAMEEKNQSGYSTILLFTDDMVETEDEIIEYVKENIGDNRIFPFGIDTSVNSYFINKLAEFGYGKPEFIYPGERIEDMVLRQFNRITNPQVDVLSIDWGALEVERTYPRTIDYLYDREPISIFARVHGEVGGKVLIRGKVKDRDYIKSIDLDKLDLEANAYLIEKVWNRKRIESITERMWGERGDTAEAMRKKIVEISKESGIISRETSFVMLEQMDEPVLGMSINRIIPVQVSEEVMRSIADAYFLDSPSFFYKLDIREKMIEEKLDRETAKEAMKFDRENLLRILAKNQSAEGAFVDYGEQSLQKKIEGTTIGILAFTLGKEDITIYSNQMNKAVKFLIKHLDESEDIFNEKLILLTFLALKSCITKEFIKQLNRNALENYLEKLQKIMDDNKYTDIECAEYCKSYNLKDSVVFMLGLSYDNILNVEKVLKNKGNEAITDIAKFAIYKTL